MRAIVITAIVAGAIGFVAGNAFWYLASPLWIDRIVSETLTADAQAKTIATGQFSDADSAHRGTGEVGVIATGSDTIIRFTEFEVTNRPDLYVWLVKAGQLKTSADVKASEWIELGILKGNIGDQNYVLPAGVNVADYQSVVIWCRQFGVLFSSADLTGG